MRNTPNMKAEVRRAGKMPGMESDITSGNNGLFVVNSFSRTGLVLCCIVSDCGGWEHVSVSVLARATGAPARCLPTWEEMEQIRELFWTDDEWVVQYSPARQEKINCGEVLHLWKPVGSEPCWLPVPPPEFIGPKS